MSVVHRDPLEKNIENMVRYLRTKGSRKKASMSVFEIARETRQGYWQVVKDRESGRLEGFNYYHIAKYIVKEL